VKDQLAETATDPTICDAGPDLEISEPIKQIGEIYLLLNEQSESTQNYVRL
jgi:hypothetical protein